MLLNRRHSPGIPTMKGTRTWSTEDEQMRCRSTYQNLQRRHTSALGSMFFNCATCDEEKLAVIVSCLSLQASSIKFVIVLYLRTIKYESWISKI